VNLVVTTANSVYVYNEQLSLVRQINSNQSEIGLIFLALLSLMIYLFGHKRKWFTFYTLAGSSVFENLTPAGPLRNACFCKTTTTTALWTVYGDYDVRYNPYDLDNYGISRYSNEGWLNSYDKVLGAKSMVRITIKQPNEND
jgi:hypothetical protein